MREIFPENNYTEIVGKDSDIVKREDILPITEQLNQTKQALETLAAAFEDYKDDIAETVNTNALNAITAAITTINVTLANLENAEVDNLTVSSLATLATLSAQIATITTSLTAPEATINNIQSLDVESISGNFNSLSAQTAEIDNWNVSNFTISNLEATSAEFGTVEATSSQLGTAAADSITITNDASIGGDASITGELSASGVTSDEIKIENITWKGSIALSDVEDFYIEVPHFENGQYYIQLQDNNVPFITIEIFNSVDNYMVRWSQSELNQLRSIMKYGSGTSSQIYFRIENATGNALTMKYATESVTANVQGPETYTTLPIEPEMTYQVVYQSGTKLFSNIDLARDGGTAGVLAHRTTDLYELNTDTWNYDGTNNVSDTTYKPDQSLNQYDDVRFRTVDSTFLDVADLEIAGKFKGKHIYDAEVLQDPSTLEDDTLYITQATVNGTIGDSGRLSVFDTETQRITTIRGWSSSFINAFNQDTYENTTYKPQDGYTLGEATVEHRASCTLLQEVNSGRLYFQGLRTGGAYVLRHFEDITIQDGTVIIPDSSSSYAYDRLYFADGTPWDYAAWNKSLNPGDIMYSMQDNVRTDFYVVFGTGGTSFHGLRLRLEATSSIPYTRLDPTAKSTIQRKTTKNNATQVLPIIPYEEVSTQQTPVDNTHPLVYDNSTDSIKKSTGDITIDGDLDVGTDLSVAGDTSITGDATVGGDLNITGDISATDFELSGNLNVAGTTTIHGDLYVDGVTHTTKEESVSTTGDVVVLRQNNSTSLGATYAGMLINKYDGSHDLALVTDSDGTLRVGTGTGADTVYQNLYWDNDTEKWYSDAALTTEVSPVGTLTSWDSLETLGDVLHYTNAVFTVINFNGLVPLLARDEATNMNADGFLQWDSTNLIAKAKSVSGLTNGALLKWNSTTKMFENIGDTPAANEFLSYNGTAYDWKTPPKAYVFATMADYNAAASSVPDGSVVYITSLPNYLRAGI